MGAQAQPAAAAGRQLCDAAARRGASAPQMRGGPAALPPFSSPSAAPPAHPAESKPAAPPPCRRAWATRCPSSARTPPRAASSRSTKRWAASGPCCSGARSGRVRRCRQACTAAAAPAACRRRRRRRRRPERCHHDAPSMPPFHVCSHPSDFTPVRAASAAHASAQRACLPARPPHAAAPAAIAAGPSTPGSRPAAPNKAGVHQRAGRRRQAAERVQETGCAADCPELQRPGQPQAV